MKEKIGRQNVLYPTPVTVVAALVEDKVNFSAKVRPLLFDMSSRKYWSLGESVGHCWKEGRGYDA